MTADGLTVGALVTYRDVNLRDYHGRIESRDGNRVIVQWFGVRLPTVEWAPNLMVRTERVIAMPSARALACRFVRELESRLTGAEMRMVRRRNARFRAAGRHTTCGSHDFCDANMAMGAAWRALTGVDPDVGDERCAERWSAAWALADRLFLGGGTRRADTAGERFDDLDECADCGGSTAPGTPDPHVCPVPPTVALRAAGLPVRPCGLSADWSCEAWHLGPSDDPNRIDGDLYLLSDEDSDRHAPLYHLARMSPSERDRAEDGADGITLLRESVSLDVAIQAAIERLGGGR